MARGERSLFWDQQCASRQPGLLHKHDRDCTDGHLSDQCCECGVRSSQWVATPFVVVQTSPETPPPDHAYVPTLFGMCARGCGRKRDDHPGTSASSDECNHRAIPDVRTSGETGERWQECGACGVQVEPAAATGHPDGPSWGRGRGDPDLRDTWRWGFISFLVKKGVLKS